MILQDWETEGEGFIHYCSNSDTRATHGQSPFFNFIFLLGYNCFTVLLVSVVQHHESATCIHISLPSWTSLPPPPQSTPRPSQSTELSSPFCASRQLSISHMVVDLCLCYSLNSFPLSPSLPVSTSAFSTSAPLFLACNCVHLSHFSRFRGCVSLVAQSLKLCNPVDSIAHQSPLSMGILQARIRKWVAIPSSRGSSQPGDWTQLSCIAGGFFSIWSAREAP